MAGAGDRWSDYDDGYSAGPDVLARTGTFKVCKGQQCLGNPAVNTPVLAYGHSTSSGPFRCLSTTAGVTCTVSGKGFQISRSGITAVHPRSST